MREIKLKAWFEDKREMKKVAMNNVYFLKGEYFYLSHLPCSDFEKIRLVQYTGLKDKSGREIYEGDILAIGNTYYNIGYRAHSGGWQLELPLGVFCTEAVASNCDALEVVGNIYENLDLVT